MSVFNATSRYLLHAQVIQSTDRLGRVVACVTPALIPPAARVGLHRRRDSQRIDHLAERYLGDATAFWRIADHNDAMSLEQIADAPFVAIPVKGA